MKKLVSQNDVLENPESVDMKVTMIGDIKCNHGNMKLEIVS